MRLANEQRENLTTQNIRNLKRKICQRLVSSFPFTTANDLSEKPFKSVLDQSFRDFELVVVDDGSTDKTETIVGQFAGPILYHRQENEGAGAARSAGVMFARGEWIAFTDADDVWETHKLTKQLEYLQRHPNVAFVYCDMDLMDSQGN